MDSANSFARLARQIAIGIGLFLVGGAIAFGYSWRPLHGALSWKVEQLELRLDERNRENLALSDELESLQTSEHSRIDPETLAQVERELAKTQSALAKVEKKLEKAERKHKDANASATRWRKRYESMRESVAERPAPAPQTGPEADAPSVAEAPPPSPAPATSSASGETPDAAGPPAAAAPDTPSQPAPESGIFPDPERNALSTP